MGETALQTIVVVQGSKILLLRQLKPPGIRPDMPVGCLGGMPHYPSAPADSFVNDVSILCSLRVKGGKGDGIDKS